MMSPAIALLSLAITTFIVVEGKIHVSLLNRYAFNADTTDAIFFECYVTDSNGGDVNVTVRREIFLKYNNNSNYEPCIVEPISSTLYKVILPNRGDVPAFGAYVMNVSSTTDSTLVRTLLMRSDADILPSNHLLTKTTSRGNTNVTIEMRLTNTSSSVTDLRWRKGGKYISERRGHLTLNISDSKELGIKPSGYYECFFNRKRNNLRHGIQRLIVRGCPDDLWNLPNCNYTCHNCYNGGICDEMTGECICPAGFFGTNCLSACRGGGRFGFNCAFKCNPNSVSPDACREAVICLPDPLGCRCASGFKGYNCSNECDPGTFGANCLQVCRCAGGSPCNIYTGQCKDGCADGYTGRNCQVPPTCKTGYYGNICADKCRCRNNVACDRRSGRCSNEECPSIAPFGVRVISIDGSLNVSWMIPASPFRCGILRFVIYITELQDDSNDTLPNMAVNVTDTSTSSFALHKTQLRAGKKYTFQVTLVSEGGESPFSEISNESTILLPVDGVSPTDNMQTNLIEKALAHPELTIILSGSGLLVLVFVCVIIVLERKLSPIRNSEGTTADNNVYLVPREIRATSQVTGLSCQPLENNEENAGNSGPNPWEYHRTSKGTSDGLAESSIQRQATNDYENIVSRSKNRVYEAPNDQLEFAGGSSIKHDLPTWSTRDNDRVCKEGIGAEYTHGIVIETGEPNPICRTDFVEFYHWERKGDFSQLVEEFKLLTQQTNSIQDGTSAIGMQDINAGKNRFRAIVPPDNVRPSLEQKGQLGGKQYINATLYTDPNSGYECIATQSPLPETFEDFWKLVYTWKCPTIIMLNETTISKETQCHQYWVDNGSVHYGKMTAQCTSTEISDQYIHRQFKLSKYRSKGSHNVEQYQLVGWPSSVKEDLELLVNVIKETCSESFKGGDTQGPLLIHCIDGVGRSGIFMAVRSEFDRLQKQGNINVFDTVKNMRKQNQLFLTNQEHYFLSYGIIASSLEMDEYSVI
ncbi:uncharacterized protein [Apostichopus japonicus]|uniref:uncharacterized protein n=1 Tax=Stichopus japonicus TaxID=307972 RepID=UPI003AB2B3D2